MHLLIIVLVLFSLGLFCRKKGKEEQSLPSEAQSKKTQRQEGQSSSRYTGIVPQQNGKWGAQIYANHQRIWIGTFKSEEEAAKAYDTAALKLRPRDSGDSSRNVPSNTSPIEYEFNFQDLYTVGQVLNMIKDGSYQGKFDEYLRMSQLGGIQTTPYDNTKIKGYSSQELFRKELTPSDVGKLNRLVIPKVYAIKYFSRVNLNKGEDKELIFFDKSMRKWSFRYCYWKSSHSFVLTKGWKRFVKEKKLKANDIVAFYLCELTQNNNYNNNNNHYHNSTLGEEVDKFHMIGIFPCNVGENPPSTKENRGLRLFGVQIS